MYLGALLAYPLVEIFLFILVARLVGWSNAFLLTVATSFLGYALIRAQRRWQIFGQNNFTAKSIENYLFCNLGAFALLIPGFLSDIFGLFVVIPWTRRLLLWILHIIRFDVSKRTNGPFSVFKTYSFGNDFRRQNDVPTGNIYDAEFEEIKINEHNQSPQTVVKNPEDDKRDDIIDVEFTVRD